MSDLENLTDLVPTESTDFEPPELVKIQLAGLVATGVPVSSIALELGYSEAWVRKHKKDPDIRAITMSIQKEALETAKSTLVSNTARAASAIVSLTQDAPPAIRLAAAKDILDRFGMRAPEKKQIEANIVVTDIPRDERIKAIRNRAERLGLVLQGEVISDATE